MGVLQWLRSRGADEPAAPDDACAQKVQRVLELSPRLRLVRRHDTRLRFALTEAQRYLDRLVATLPAPRLASASTWGSDPCIHAYFGSADDVGLCLSRSSDLRSYFDQSPLSRDAYAVMGMEMSERRTLGVAMQGEVMRSDVAQTTLSFTDHQVRICADSEDALRREIVQRMLDQLVLEALAKVAADEFRRDMLEKERVLLATRLRLLERRGTGMRSMVGGPGTEDLAKRARLQAEMEENDRALADLGSRTESLGHQLDIVCERLVNASEYMKVSSRRVRLSRMNVVQPDEADEAGEMIELHSARVPGDPPLERTFALVQVNAAELLKTGQLLERASRMI